MTQYMIDLIPAVALGLGIAIPFGPIGVMCVQRTLALGAWFGIASGMGAATAHGILSCVAATGAVALAQISLATHTPLRIAGGIVLVFMGARIILMPPRAAHDAKTGDLLSAYTSTLLIAAANPMTILPYLAIASAENGTVRVIDRALTTSVGVTLGSAVWYLVLTLSANTMLRGLRQTALDRLNTFAGILLMALGAVLCARSI